MLKNNEHMNHSSDKSIENKTIKVLVRKKTGSGTQNEDEAKTEFNHM